MATWFEKLPFVLLGLRAQPSEDTGLSPAEAVFGTLIVLPTEFLQNEEISVNSIIKKLSKTLDVPFFLLHMFLPFKIVHPYSIHTIIH
jgi:hypothetical protein